MSVTREDRWNYLEACRTVEAAGMAVVHRDTVDKQRARAERAESALAEVTAERDKLLAACPHIEQTLRPEDGILVCDVCGTESSDPFTLLHSITLRPPGVDPE